MAFILTVQAMAQCPHGGVASLASLVGNPMVKIGGVPVLTQMNVGPVPFSCPFTVTCVTVTSWIPNQVIMKVGGMFVLSDASIPVTNNGPGVITFAGQTLAKVK